MFLFDCSALNNLIEISDEEVVYLMMKFCEKLEGKSSSYLDGKSKDKFSRIFVFFEETLHYWIGKISEAVEGNLFPIQQNKLAVLWAVIGCYSHFADAQANQSLLMELINAIDKLLMVGSSKTFPDALYPFIVNILKNVAVCACFVEKNGLSQFLVKSSLVLLERSS